MLKSRLLALVLMLPIALMLMGARKAELINPEPFLIPDGLTEQQVKSTIKTSLAGRTWLVTDEQAGRINATLNIRAHQAKIAVHYDLASKKIRVEYVDSSNLNYLEKKGKVYIHSNYIGWVNNLVGDLSRNLNAIATP